MEDLVPFLIFIVIAVINILKFVVEKGRKPQAPSPSGKAVPKRTPSTIEAFFEEIAEKLEPKPTELPDWPEGRERPDYVHQMDGVRFSDVEAMEERAPVSEPIFQPLEPLEPATVQASDFTAAFKPHVQSTSSAFSGSAMRLPALPTPRKSSLGRIDFDLKRKGNLKKAVIASIVFGQPRVYDRSFDTTLAK